MKYYTIIFCLFFLLKIISAQEKLDNKITPWFGFKGGINYTTLIPTKLEDRYEIENKNKFTVGFFVPVPLSKKFILNVELLYSMKLFKVIHKYVDPRPGMPTEGYWHQGFCYIQVPFLVNYILKGDHLNNLRIFAGPSIDSYSVVPQV